MYVQIYMNFKHLYKMKYAKAFEENKYLWNTQKAVSRKYSL